MKKLLLNVFSIGTIGLSSPLMVANLSTSLETQSNEWVQPTSGDILYYKSLVIGANHRSAGSAETINDIYEFSYAKYGDTIDEFFEKDPIIGSIGLDFYVSVGNKDKWKSSRYLLDSYHNTQGPATELKKYLNTYVLIDDFEWQSSKRESYAILKLEITNDAANKKIIFNVKSSLQNENVWSNQPVYNKIVFMG